MKKGARCTLGICARTEASGAHAALVIGAGDGEGSKPTGTWVTSQAASTQTKGPRRATFLMIVHAAFRGRLITDSARSGAPPPAWGRALRGDRPRAAAPRDRSPPRGPLRRAAPARADSLLPTRGCRAGIGWRGCRGTRAPPRDRDRPVPASLAG